MTPVTTVSLDEVGDTTKVFDLPLIASFWWDDGLDARKVTGILFIGPFSTKVRSSAI